MTEIRTHWVGDGCDPAHDPSASGALWPVSTLGAKDAISRSDVPIRQKSCNGEPKPFSTFTRRCLSCGACFLQLSVGRTGERGLWIEGRGWACSQECHDKARR